MDLLDAGAVSGGVGFGIAGVAEPPVRRAANWRRHETPVAVARTQMRAQLRARGPARHRRSPGSTLSPHSRSRDVQRPPDTQPPLRSEAGPPTTAPQPSRASDRKSVV